ncbi:phosphate signaling complex protein PhoU [Alkalihalobacillus trypoxylicola]|nr:phosphate signaling complex protein PhoU [Alkalihalobacillus trypoxylicola]
MVGREGFRSQLDEIKNQLLHMGSSISSVLEKAKAGFRSGNEDVLHQLIKEDEKINQLEHELNDSVTLLITKQQPVASDLRRLIVTLKISSDLERVGDLAVDLAKASLRLDPNLLIEIKEKMIIMLGLAEQMIAESLEAYSDSDVMAAQKIASLDDHVDQMYGELIHELFQLDTNEVEVHQITELAFIGRYIERMADYATNITEWVIYEANGQHFDLN